MQCTMLCTSLGCNNLSIKLHWYHGRSSLACAICQCENSIWESRTAGHQRICFFTLFWGTPGNHFWGLQAIKSWQTYNFAAEMPLVPIQQLLWGITAQFRARKHLWVLWLCFSGRKCGNWSAMNWCNEDSTLWVLVLSPPLILYCKHWPRSSETIMLDFQILIYAHFPFIRK